MYSSVDTIWVLLGAVLVFSMQAGFAMLEVGFTRAKNAGNIIMKNLLDFAIGAVAYYLVGFGLMFGPSIGGIIGLPDFLVRGDYSSTIPTPVFLIFQTMFCATGATIVSGAMAERTKFITYLIYSLIITMFIYPISGHWIWGGGWLSQLGFHDFAGSTAVHLVGGLSALIGAKMLGARLGKYNKDGTPNAIPGHSLTLGALGALLLWFGWFGFNGASTAAASGDDTLLSIGSIFMTTNLAAAAGTIGAMAITWVRYKKPDISMTINGALAGLVGVTAGCDVVSPVGAIFIGLIASVIVVFGIEFVDKKLRVDDPVGAIGVHFLCGASGTLMVGLFAVDGGLFYGGGVALLGVQALGVLAVSAWVGITISLVFWVLKKTIGLRVHEAEEIEGLDISEHGLASSYADFMPMPLTTAGISIPASGPVQTPVVISPVHEKSAEGEIKMTKLTMIIRQNKLEELTRALNAIGITGMTVTQVLGYGAQKGKTEYYRGVGIESNLLPKAKVEVVVSKIDPRTVIETAQRVLRTGNIGDGKIFQYDVENVVKVRTGEEGYDALQDEA